MQTRGLASCALLVALATAVASSTVRLRGINRSGSEYSCVQNNGIFEGPVDEQSVQYMTYWKINSVRVPMNEDCWLDLNGHNSAYTGENYQNAIIDYVTLLRKYDLQVILELHWSDGYYSSGSCSDYAALCQKPMPNRANTPTFWKSVATTFQNDNGVIFDLFNEPFPDRVISDETQAWTCWRDGGSACPWFEFEAAGMQELVDAVRSTGAENLVMLGGLAYSNDLSHWAEFAPTDSADNMAASWHSYNFNPCNYEDCWKSTIATVAANYTVIAGEIGEHGCSHDYIDSLMPWLDENEIGFLGWTWNVWDCSSGPALISSYDGTPTTFGQGLKDYLYNTYNSSS